MASTVGGIKERVADLLNQGKYDMAVMLDAVASECADSGLDFLMQSQAKLMQRQGERLTNRYSPGYGDLPLSFQKSIFDILELNKINLSISPTFMLEPEKSVLALAGVIE
jgi:cobalamin-dependent methionine synthase I